MNLRSLLTIRVKSKGSKAVEEAITDFEEIIQDLNNALVETEEECIEAEYAVEEAKNERNRICETLVKGENLINGLKALLKG